MVAAIHQLDSNTAPRALPSRLGDSISSSLLLRTSTRSSTVSHTSLALMERAIATHAGAGSARIANANSAAIEVLLSGLAASSKAPTPTGLFIVFGALADGVVAGVGRGWGGGFDVLIAEYFVAF